MSFRQVYRERQLVEDLILPLSWYVDDAKLLHKVDDITLIASRDLDPNHVLAYIVQHPPSFIGHPDLGMEHTIVVCEDLPRDFEKFLCLKELMHCYFTANSGTLTDSAQVLRRHMVELFGELATSQSMQLRAEKQAVWMALSLICPESARRRFQEKVYLEKSTSVENVASKLGIPPPMAERLLQDEYSREIQEILTNSI